MALKMVQMGARVYLPTLGRFSSVDPVQGGTPNNYMYTADPVNDFDLDGRCSVASCAQALGQFIGRNADTISTGLAIGGLVACTVATIGACGVAASAAFAGASGAVAFMGAKYQGQSTGKALVYGGISAGLNYVPFAKNLKSVRWYGSGRQYKSIVTAFKGGKSAINKQALKRATNQIKQFTGGQALGSAFNHLWNKKTRRWR